MQRSGRLARKLLLFCIFAVEQLKQWKDGKFKIENRLSDSRIGLCLLSCIVPILTGKGNPFFEPAGMGTSVLASQTAPKKTASFKFFNLLKFVLQSMSGAEFEYRYSMDGRGTYNSE